MTYPLLPELEEPLFIFYPSAFLSPPSPPLDLTSSSTPPFLLYLLPPRWHVPLHSLCLSLIFNRSLFSFLCLFLPLSFICIYPWYFLFTLLPSQNTLFLFSSFSAPPKFSSSLMVPFFHHPDLPSSFALLFLSPSSLPSPLSSPFGQSLK